SVTSLLSPTASANVSDTVGCRPLGVSFTNSSVNATSYIWYFGDGNSSTDFEPVHVYSQVGIFQPYMIATSQNGCSDTISISPVNVNVTPVASFIASTTEICPSSSVTFNSTSSSISNPTYQWNVGGITSGLSSPTITLTQPGFHSVSLTVTNDNGCSDTHTETNYIEVFDNVPPPVTEILSVSVLNNTSVEIKWLPSAAFDLYEYRLYRLNPATNSYNLIYSLIDTNNANPNVNLVYVDNGLNTLHNVYTYKVQTVDRCSYSLPLSQSKAHTTIDVTAQPAGQNIKVSWTPYGGCPVSVYEIRRVELPNGSSVFLGTVPGNGPLIFIDTTLSCPYQYSYRITARDLCGNVYKSLSDTSAASPINTLAGQKVEVIRSTVIFNKNVLTEWTAPNIAPDRVKQYSILRSTDNFNFTPVATVPAGTYNFMDENVDVNKYHYYYKIDVVNDCSLTGTQSNEGSSILLKSNWEKEKTRLNWSEYEEWDSGVEYYRIEKRDPSGQWIQIKIVNGQETETILDE
ncbi:MAG: PKD domain-containing protein, partial [Bacteroidia bacterium]|nr:PKD domain-containing protein [Bacteroidia bacterium]